MGTSHPSALSQSREFVVCFVGAVEFGLNILDVREIRGWTTSTPLPHSQAGMRGIIELRGTVLPILDLSVRLGFEETTPSATHAIIVVQRNDVQVGLLVGGVSEILTLAESSIQAVPDTGSTPMAQELLSGVAMLDGRIISLLAMDALLPSSGHDRQAA